MATPSGPAELGRIELYSDIGGEGLRAVEIRRLLEEMGDVKTIELTIHSRGGSVFEAFPIAVMLARHPARVEATIEGVALSAASYIAAAAADHIRISAAGLMMIHDAWARTRGNIAVHQASIELLTKIQPILIDAYDKRMSWEREKIEAAMAAGSGDGTFFNAPEALAAGLVDEIVDLDPPQNAIDLSGFRGAPADAVARFAAPKTMDPEEALAAEVLTYLERAGHQQQPFSAHSADDDGDAAAVALCEQYLDQLN